VDEPTMNETPRRRRRSRAIPPAVDLASGRRPGLGMELATRDDGTLTLLPSTDRERIAYRVARWEFAGCGNRPIDHIGRDLLFGSLARD
jgi:hypothetical protein